MSEKIRAVGKNRRQRNFDLRLVDGFGYFACDVTEHRADGRAPDYRLQELADSVCEAMPSCKNRRQQNLKQNHGSPIIEQTFTFHNDGKSLRYGKLPED